MLFRGVKQDELLGWDAAINRAKDDVRMWQDVIGIDIEKVRDPSLFTVLEWGGMEVLDF